MALRIAVVGAGAAGSAAAWLLAKSGAAPLLFDAGRGASALYSGVLDGEPPDADSLAFADALGIWRLEPGRTARVVTSSCVLRECRGADRALLDCEGLLGGCITIADLPRPDWDARLLARALEATAWAKHSRTRFEVRSVELFEDPAERLLDAYDFGRQFDDERRRSALGTALRRAGAADAWLLGPWLGLERTTLEQLRAMLGSPIGETTSWPGGLAGARFELARDRLLEQVGVELERTRVHALEPRSDGVELELQEPGGARRRLELDGLILAIGGVAGAGVRVAQSFGERAPARPFELSIAGALPLGLDGRRIDDLASLHGPDLSSVGLAALERIGVLTDGARVRDTARILAAGDVVAGRPRTMLEAVRAGCEAARRMLSSTAR